MEYQIVCGNIKVNKKFKSEHEAKEWVLSNYKSQHNIRIVEADAPLVKLPKPPKRKKGDCNCNDTHYVNSFLGTEKTPVCLWSCPIHKNQFTDKVVV